MSNQTAAWSFPIEWSRSFDERIKFQTEILYSRAGKEQRIGQRQNPRIDYDFESFLSFQNFQKALLRVSENQGKTMSFPHPRNSDSLALPVSVDDTSFTVNTADAWMDPGNTLFLTDGDTVEAITVSQRSGGIIDTVDPIANAFPVGTKVYRGIQGYFSRESQLRAATSRVGRSTVEFEADPVNTWHPDYDGLEPALINGKEHFDLGHQWANDLQISVEQDYIHLDLQRGAVDRVYPVAYSTRHIRLSFVLRTDDHFNRVIGLFYRSRGRQKSFYMDLHSDEIRPLAITPGNILNIEGEDFFNQFQNSTMYRRIRVKTKDGLDLITEITDVALDAFSNTVITLADSFVSSYSVNDIKSIKWVALCRFETDSLLLEWLTDGVAETEINIRTLEDSV